MRRKMLKNECNVFRKTVPRLFEMICSMDRMMTKIIGRESYSFDQVTVIEKMTYDVIAVSCVYRDNFFFNKVKLGSLNASLSGLSDVVGDLEKVSREADGLAVTIRDSIKLYQQNEDHIEKPDNFEYKLLQLDMQLGEKFFEIRRAYLMIRSLLMDLRFIVMRDYTRILMGVDLIQEYKRSQKEVQRIVIKALPLEEFAKLNHKGGDSDDE